MTTTSIAETTFTTGDPKDFKFTFQVNGTAIDIATQVQVAITNVKQSEIIVAARDATWDAVNEVWVAAFTGEETAQLLSNPDDLTSSVKHPTCIVEIQAGTPYNLTKKITGTVGKGLIA